MKAAVSAIKFFEKFSNTGLRGRITEKIFEILLRGIKPRGKLILENLERVYPHSSELWRKDIRSEVYKNLAWTLAETLALQKNQAQALDWVKVKNEKIINDLMRQNHGALLLSGHFGNWELGASWLTQNAIKHGHKMYVIYQAIHDKDIDEYLIKMREDYGLVMLDKNISVMKISHLLKDGAHIILLNDVSGESRLRVPFMGVDATNMPGPALMAMLSGCAVVPLCIFRDAPFEHELEIFEPLEFPDIKNHEERLNLITLEMNKAVEKFIRMRPSQWFWLHNRWKN
ncbi:MAG: lysophospholipid acyltransferase family protein [Synergistaceae bacterium]|nr:lysophospholipid acyltransferase family protein [Synergistaceae bacterium]